MKSFEEFCSSVCKSAPRATGDERIDISSELNAHMEDHYDALVARGVPEDEAESRAVESMGDPEEIGRSLNATLSPVWLLFSRICTVILALVLLGSILPGIIALSTVYSNVQARFASGTGPIQSDQIEIVSTPCDITFEVDTQIVTIYGYGTCIEDGEYSVFIDAVTYAKNPFDICVSDLLSYLSIDGKRTLGGSQSNSGATYSDSAVPAAHKPDSVTLSFNRYGYSFETELVLDWGAAS